MMSLVSKYITVVPLTVENITKLYEDGVIGFDTMLANIKKTVCKDQCEHLWKEYENAKEYVFRKCVFCHTQDRLVANGPDDYEWEECE